MAYHLLVYGMVSRQRRRTTARGFTLIELMIVVAIIAILSALAVYAVRKYVLAAQSAEAVEIINSIRAAEESYKDETFKYKAVGTMSSFFPFGSASELGNVRMSWLAGDAATLAVWDELGVRPSGPVQFGYGVAAGEGGTLPTQTEMGAVHANPLPATATGWWYVVRATGNRDGRGERATFIGSSLSDRIYSENDSE